MPKIDVGNTFVERNQDLPLLSGDGGVGRRVWRDDSDGGGADRGSVDVGQGQGQGKDEDPSQAAHLFYAHPRGELWVGDSLAWLAQLAPGSVDLVIADPPYNAGKQDWDQFPSQDDYIGWSLRWIELASRALAPHGSLYVCGFSEILADLRRPAARLFAGCRWLVWAYKNKANLRSDWGRSHESILHLRKSRRVPFHVDDVRVPYGKHTLRYPDHPQAASSQYGGGRARKGAWRPHPAGAKPRDVFDIPVTANGMAEKTPHPTQKPEELIRKLVLASSSPGDVVVDPFAGSGTSLVCAEQLGRRWLGCDLDPQYCEWAMMRIERVPRRSVDEWIALDRDAAERRVSIR